MSGEQSNNPLHGLTLESIVVKLVDHYGWDELASTEGRVSSVKSVTRLSRKADYASLYLSQSASGITSET
jgi:uncharacterized protein (DUF2132 family)